LKISDSASVRAFIVQLFEPRFFYVCPECKKKLLQENNEFTCQEHGKVAPEKRAILNIILDDGTETIRAVLFHENISALGINSFENPELLTQEKENALGKELVFSGNIRMNKFFNNPEFIIDSVKEVDLDELVSKLEK